MRKKIEGALWRATSTVPMDLFNAENLCIEENEDGAQNDDEDSEEAKFGKLNFLIYRKLI